MKVDDLIKKLQNLREKWGNLDVYCDTPGEPVGVSRPVSVSVEGSLPDYACISIKLE